MKKTTMFLSMGLVLVVAACGTRNDRSSVLDESSDASASSDKILTGSNAKTLFSAMRDSGVQDPRHAEGAVLLNAEEMTCDAPVVPNPVPRCSIISYGKTFEAPAAAAAQIYKVLIQNGAVVDTGLVGNSHAVAKDVSCSQAVVPNPHPGCTFNFSHSDRIALRCHEASDSPRYSLVIREISASQPGKGILDVSNSEGTMSSIPMTCDRGPTDGPVASDMSRTVWNCRQSVVNGMYGPGYHVELKTMGMIAGIDGDLMESIMCRPPEKVARLICE